MTCETARQREARQGMVGLGKGWGGPSGEGLAALFLWARGPLPSLDITPAFLGSLHDLSKIAR